MFESSATPNPFGIVTSFPLSSSIVSVCSNLTPPTTSATVVPPPDDVLLPLLFIKLAICLNSSCSFAVPCFHWSVAFLALVIIPLFPTLSPIATAESINKTTMVTTNAIKVIPFYFLFYFFNYFFLHFVSSSLFFLMLIKCEKTTPFRFV